MLRRPCWVEIRAQALENNFRFLNGIAAPHAELLAIVKANAYGHSLGLCAPAIVRAGASWLGVTSVEEGVEARSVCPEARILVIGGVFPGQGIDVVANSLTSVIWEPSQLNEIEAAAHAAGAAPASVPVHLELDTGMSRQGTDEAHLDLLLTPFSPDSPLRLEAVMTHLFAADEADGRVTGEQLERVDAALKRVFASGLRPEILNIGNSAALLGGQVHAIEEIAKRHGLGTMLRPGLALYGLVPEFDPAFAATEPQELTQGRIQLQPVLSWKSKVVSLRSVKAGTSVGYNGTFVATEPMRLALIAVGYADGLDRKLGNHFSLLVRGHRAPIVGRISMDQTVVDVTEIEGVEPGDEVVLLGSQGNQVITAADHAKVSETIPWEVFTRIGPRVARLAV